MKYCIVILFLLNCFNLPAQLISIEHAIDHTESVINNYLATEKLIYDGSKSVEIDYEYDEFSIEYRWKDNLNVLYDEFRKDSINYNELIFNPKKIERFEKGKENSKYTIQVFCADNTKNCFDMPIEAILPNFSRNFSDRPRTYNHFPFINLFYFDSEELRDYIFMAMNYIFDKIRNEENEVNIPDIFSNQTYVEMPLLKMGEVSYIEVDFGGLKRKVILDSGASDISVSTSLETNLINHGVITSKDYLSEGLYVIANGDIVSSRRFIIPFIELGSVKINNVLCSVNSSEDITLFGMNFLNQLKSWKIDNENNTLILEPK